MSVEIKDTNGNWVKAAGGVSNTYAPIGAIFPFGGSNIPDGYLLCNGQAVSRAGYSDLFNVIGTSFGSGDGSTTFNVPDLRETVPVGSGTRASGVSAHDTYDIGTFRDDQLQNITGGFNSALNYPRDRGVLNATGAFSGTATITDGNSSENDLTTKTTISFNAANVARTGTTTHGKQLGVNYIIKAKDVNMSSAGQAIADRVNALENGTSDGIVDSVTDGEIRAVSSNAVYDAIEKKHKKYATENVYGINFETAINAIGAQTRTFKFEFFAKDDSCYITGFITRATTSSVPRARYVGTSGYMIATNDSGTIACYVSGTDTGVEGRFLCKNYLD